MNVVKGSFEEVVWNQWTNRWCYQWLNELDITLWCTTVKSKSTYHQSKQHWISNYQLKQKFRNFTVIWLKSLTTALKTSFKEVKFSSELLFLWGCEIYSIKSEVQRFYWKTKILYLKNIFTLLSPQSELGQCTRNINILNKFSFSVIEIFKI